MIRILFIVAAALILLFIPSSAQQVTSPTTGPRTLPLECRGQVIQFVNYLVKMFTTAGGTHAEIGLRSQQK